MLKQLEEYDSSIERTDITILVTIELCSKFYDDIGSHITAQDTISIIQSFSKALTYGRNYYSHNRLEMRIFSELGYCIPWPITRISVSEELILCLDWDIYNPKEIMKHVDTIVTISTLENPYFIPTQYPDFEEVSIFYAAILLFTCDNLNIQGLQSASISICIQLETKSKFPAREIFKKGELLLGVHRK